MPIPQHVGPARSYDYYPLTVVSENLVYDIHCQGSWSKGILDEHIVEYVGAALLVFVGRLWNRDRLFLGLWDMPICLNVPLDRPHV